MWAEAKPTKPERSLVVLAFRRFVTPEPNSGS